MLRRKISIPKTIASKAATPYGLVFFTFFLNNGFRSGIYIIKAEWLGSVSGLAPEWVLVMAAGSRWESSLVPADLKAEARFSYHSKLLLLRLHYILRPHPHLCFEE